MIASIWPRETKVATSTTKNQEAETPTFGRKIHAEQSSMLMHAYLAMREDQIYVGRLTDSMVYPVTSLQYT